MFAHNKSSRSKLFKHSAKVPFLEACEDTTEWLKPTERRLNNERYAMVLRVRSVCKPSELRQNTIGGKHRWRGVLTALHRLSNLCGLIGIPVLKQAGELHRILSHCRPHAQLCQQDDEGEIDLLPSLPSRSPALSCSAPIPRGERLRVARSPQFGCRLCLLS